MEMPEQEDKEIDLDEEESAAPVPEVTRVEDFWSKSRIASLSRGKYYRYYKPSWAAHFTILGFGGFFAALVGGVWLTADNIAITCPIIIGGTVLFGAWLAYILYNPLTDRFAPEEPRDRWFLAGVLCGIVSLTSVFLARYGESWYLSVEYAVIATIFAALTVAFLFKAELIRQEEVHGIPQNWSLGFWNRRKVCDLNKDEPLPAEIARLLPKPSSTSQASS